MNKIKILHQDQKKRRSNEIINMPLFYFQFLTGVLSFGLRFIRLANIEMVIFCHLSFFLPQGKKKRKKRRKRKKKKKKKKNKERRKTQKSNHR